MRLVPLAGLLLPVCFAIANLAAQSSPLEGEAFTADAALLRSVAAAHPAGTRDQGTVLYDETSYRIAAEGVVRYRRRIVYRVDVPNPAASWNEVATTWDPWYQKLPTIRARVLLPGGAFVELDPKTITDAPRISDEAETFTSGRIRKAPLPGITQGAIVEQEDIVEDRTAFSANGITRRFSFNTSLPVAFQKLTVETTADTPFHDRLHLLPGVQARTTPSALGTLRTYAVDDLPVRESGDIDLASDEEASASVSFSTGTSWAAVAAEYDRMTAPVLHSDVAPAAAPANRDATITALVQRLHREVRYTGVEFDEAAITPGTPAQTLKRHYGDCKDKSALLVSLLRQAGIPAYLALLKTGPGPELPEDMPSLDRFDHAIVYVPAQGAAPALWIDATADRSTVGTLPYMNTGRHALVIAPETTALIALPDATPNDSVLTETRDYRLPLFGNGSVVEQNQTAGYADANLRTLFGDAAAEKDRKNLEGYVRDVYGAKALRTVEHTDGTDLQTPYHLKLTVEDTPSAQATLADAAITFSPGTAWNQMPAWFATDPRTPGTDAEKEQQAKAVAGRLATYRLQPFRVEKRFRMLLPAGFTPRTLPPDKETTVGPGMFTERYRVESPTVVTATLTFTTGKSTVTTAEALSMRDALLALQKRPAVLLAADESGLRQLIENHPAAAVAEERAAIAADPHAAMPHLHLAGVLLKAGLVDDALAEARTAIAVQPGSFEAHMLLAELLVLSPQGVRFTAPFHRDEAIAEFRKALAIRADQADVRFDLAVTEEFDTRGNRYADQKGVLQAAADYRRLIADNPASASLATYQDNLLFDLFSGGDYAGVLATAAPLPPSNNRIALQAAAEGALHGADAALARVRRDQGNTRARATIYGESAQLLARAGSYPEVAALLRAQSEDGAEANPQNRGAEIFAHMQRKPFTQPDGSHPEDPVEIMLAAVASAQLDEPTVHRVLSEHAYLSADRYRHAIEQTGQANGLLHRITEHSGLSEPVMRDLLLGNLKLTSTGSDQTGHIVTAEMIGTGPQAFFVVKEADRYRIAASPSDDHEVAAYTLYALDHGQPAVARALLNWRRENLKRPDQDDSFAGPMLARFWRPDTPDLLLAWSALVAGDAPAALQAAQELLAEEPSSLTALRMAGYAFAMQHDLPAWGRMLDERLAKKPDDPEILRLRSQMHAGAGAWKAAQADEQRVIDTGHATANDYNNLAWLGAFGNNLGESTLAAARQAVAVDKNASFASLHTLATLQAMQGHVLEAQGTLVEAMNAGGTVQPNAAVYLVQGLIEQQLGLSSADATFQRAQPEPFERNAVPQPTSNWALARQHLTAQ